MDFSRDTTFLDDFDLEETNEVSSSESSKELVFESINVLKSNHENEIKEVTENLEMTSELNDKTLELLSTAELLDPSITMAPEAEVEDEYAYVEPDIHSKLGAVLVGTFFAFLVAFIVALPHLENFIN